MPAASPERVRLAQAAVAAAAVAELQSVWSRLTTAPADKLAAILAPILLEISGKYGEASGAIAADWFEDLRDDARPSGRASAVVADLPTKERMEVLSRWGVGPMFGTDPDPTAALHKVSGGLSRDVLGVGRDTLFESIASDPAEPLYARHASANACAFCALLATRGAVYTSAATAGSVSGANLGGTDYRKARRLDGGVVTAARRAEMLAGSRAKTVAQGGRKGRDTKQDIGEKFHDDCRCAVVPVWPGETYEEAPYVEKWREAYADTGSGDPKSILASMREQLGTN